MTHHWNSSIGNSFNCISYFYTTFHFKSIYSTFFHHVNSIAYTIFTTYLITAERHIA